MELSHHPLPLHLSRLRDRGNRTMGGRGGDLAPAQSAVQSGHSDALPRADFPLRCEGAATPARLSFRGRELGPDRALSRSEEHTSELQSLMRLSYAVFCLKK